MEKCGLKAGVLDPHFFINYELNLSALAGLPKEKLVLLAAARDILFGNVCRGF
ncbi:MAG: hypothetical protein HYT16_00910 [DPANN group archaeon]|nr:hypothetical protein [DPANN group archaeon]